MLELDPNEYGDFDRLTGKASQVASFRDCLSAAINRDDPNAISTLIELLAQAKRQNKVEDGKACETFYLAYQGATEDNPEGDEVASKGQIADCVARLLNAYPTARITNSAAYFNLLVEEIRVTLAGKVAVESACRKLRHELKTPPPVATVIEAVKEQKAFWTFDCDFWCIGDLVEVAEERLAELKAIEAEAASAPPTTHLKVGQRVISKQYGSGVVTRITEGSPIVDFPPPYGGLLLTESALKYVTHEDGTPVRVPERVAP